MKKQPKPAPISTNIICSICDEPWHLHKEENGEVSTLECVRLLKLKRYTPTITVTPYRPWVTPVQPYWTYTTAGSSGLQSAQTISLTTINAANTSTTMIPTIVAASAAA